MTTTMKVRNFVSFPVLLCAALLAISVVNAQQNVHDTGSELIGEIKLEGDQPGRLTTGTLGFEVVEGGKPIPGGNQPEPESTSAAGDTRNEKDGTPTKFSNYDVSENPMTQHKQNCATTLASKEWRFSSRTVQRNRLDC